jgi:ribosomal protein S19
MARSKCKPLIFNNNKYKQKNEIILPVDIYTKIKIKKQNKICFLYVTQLMVGYRICEFTSFYVSKN